MDADARACAGGIAEFVTYRKGKNLGASGTSLSRGTGCSSAGGMIYSRFSVLSAHAAVFLAVGEVEVERSASIVNCSHVTAIVANLVARGVVSILVHHRRLGSIHIIFSKVGIGTELEYTFVSAGAVTKIYSGIRVYVNMSR